MRKAILREGEYKATKSPCTEKLLDDLLSEINYRKQKEDEYTYFILIRTGTFKRENKTIKYFILMEDEKQYHCESPFIDEDYKQRRKTIKLLPE